MSKRLLLFLLLSTLYCLLSIPAFAPVPNYINYQGKLTEVDGTPLPAGSQSMTFRIYNGVGVWEETKDVYLDELGQFTTVLGDKSVYPINSIDFSKHVTLEVTINIGGGQTFIPQQSIFTVPYAFYAATAESAGGWHRNENGTIELSNPSDNVGIGIPTPGARFESKGPVAILGDPVLICYYNNVHSAIDQTLTATSDGFATIHTESGLPSYTTKATIIVSFESIILHDEIDGTIGDSNSLITLPFKMGESYNIKITRVSGDNFNMHVYWRPIGK